MEKSNLLQPLTGSEKVKWKFTYEFYLEHGVSEIKAREIADRSIKNKRHLAATIKFKH